jgi:hypothetical protein
MSLKAKRRLIISGAVLITVFVLANWGAIDPRSEPETPAHTPANRAVFGERPAPISSRPVSQPERTRSRSDLRQEIERTVEDWNATLLNGELDAHVQFYAPTVRRFFTKRDVARRAVLREKQSLLRRYPQLQTMKIDDLRVESRDGERAVATFTKNWEMRGQGRRRFAGSEIERLEFQLESGRWQIVSEEELKVHWVRRS